MLDLNKKYDVGAVTEENAGELDLDGIPLKVDVADIDKYPNEQYAIIRKHGLGTSDSSVILGVNPYTTKSELIAEKCRDYLTEEEKAVGDKTAVKKGRDLEPIIIDKFAKIMGTKCIKPTDMYVHTEYPWIKFNFDGVMDKNNVIDQYIPAEIKVVTIYGEKHYDRTKAWFRESVGCQLIPEDYSKTNNSIETKAALYGIPPYYYTQLQQQILGLDAPYGYLTVMFDKTWEVVSYFIWRDDNCINQLILEGFKVSEQIAAKRNNENWYEVPAEELKLCKVSEELKSQDVGKQIAPKIEYL